MTPPPALRWASRLACWWWLAIASAGCGTQRVTVPLVPPLMFAPSPSVLWSEPFDVLSLQRWREIEVKRRTEYSVVTLDGRSCLRAHSRNGASILLSEIHFDPKDYEWLSWSWRVDQLVDGEALDRKSGSDAAARVYVYFETAGLPWQTRNLDYVWSASLPVGTILESAYSVESKIIVVQSGTASLGRWRAVERNLKDDYKRCFHGSLPDVIAIGMMSDTDNTGTEALAYVDDLQITKAPRFTRPPERAQAFEVRPQGAQKPRVGSDPEMTAVMDGRASARDADASHSRVVRGGQ